MTLRATGVLAILLFAAPAPAQVQRHDAGQRLKAFDVAWDAQPDAAARRRALAPLKRAMAAFFAGRTAEAAHALDDARLALQGAEPSDAVRWAASLTVRPAGRFLDAGTPALTFTVEPLYDLKLAPPPQAELRLWLNGTGTGYSLMTIPVAAPLPLNNLPEGDHTLRAEVVVGGQTLVVREQTIAMVRDRDARVRAVAEAAATAGEPSVDRATLGSLSRLLAKLAAGETLEAGYPAARLLAEAEGVAKALAAKERYYGSRRPGEFWLTVPTQRGPAPVRVFMPDTVKAGKPVPVVVALHGAGGSENLFFEGYGHGAIVDRCRERGWLLVATRSAGFFGTPPVPELLDELAKLYPIDAKRAFLVGHSMGAAQTIALAQQAPGRFAAVAALGGGGNVTNADAFKHLPTFIGCGSEDFALNASRAVARKLQQEGATKVTFREYPATEHIVVVQVALPEVFAGFDAVAKSLPETPVVTPDPFEQQVFRGAAGALPYRLLKPEPFDPAKKYPLVIFLHGAGERGTDNEAQLKWVVRDFARPEVRAKYPCFVLAPQCDVPHRWVEVDWGSPTPQATPKEPSVPMGLLIELLPKLTADLPIDSSRVYVMGMSMGGFGTWDLVTRFPDRFAAVVPICGGADPAAAPALVKLPVWAFHGAKDPAVKVERSRGMVEALKRAGSTAVKYTEYPDVAHNSWVPALAEPGLFPWLFGQTHLAPRQ